MAREGGDAAARRRMSGPVAGCPVRRMSGGLGIDVRALDRGRTR